MVGPDLRVPQDVRLLAGEMKGQPDLVVGAVQGWPLCGSGMA